MAPIDPHPLRAEFSHRPDLVYLNHAGVAPIPERGARIIRELAERMARQGAFEYPFLQRIHDHARERCARLLNAPVDQVAFVPNTSEGLSFIALGVDWAAGDEVVTTDQEFPSNAVIWLDLARRFGVRVHQVPSGADGSVDAGALLERVNERTRMVTVSSVQFGGGAVVDLERIGAALRDAPTLFVVDAIQSLGVLPLDPAAVGIDALAADGHKWLLGPEGCGLLYLSDKGLAAIQPRVLGWHSVANAGDYHNISIEPRPGAKRFEAGTPNLLGAAALGESVGLLLDVGIEEVRRRVLGLMAALTHGLTARGFRFHTPMSEQGSPGAGILIFSHPDHETQALSRSLMAEGLYHAQRGKGMRFSPHFYQDDGDIKRIFAVIDQVLAGGGG